MGLSRLALEKETGNMELDKVMERVMKTKRVKETGKERREEEGIGKET